MNKLMPIITFFTILSSNQVFASKVEDCEKFYETAKEVMKTRQSGMDQMDYRNATKKQLQGRELNRRLNLIDKAYERPYSGSIPELREVKENEIKMFAERAYKLCNRGEW
jgi:hypothetical protein